MAKEADEWGGGDDKIIKWLSGLREHIEGKACEVLKGVAGRKVSCLPITTIDSGLKYRIYMCVVCSLTRHRRMMRDEYLLRGRTSGAAHGRLLPINPPGFVE